MRGLIRRLRFLAAFGWCRNDTGEPKRVEIPIFEGITPVDCFLQPYLIGDNALGTRIRADFIPRIAEDSV